MKEGAELIKGERADNDMVSRMERAMREVDEDGLEITTEVADEGNKDEDEDISSEDEMISDKSSEEEVKDRRSRVIFRSRFNLRLVNMVKDILEHCISKQASWKPFSVKSEFSKRFRGGS